MKLAINLTTSKFEVRSTFEVKKPLQKKKRPAKPKPQPSISVTTNIVNHN
jgi:hypothetical protein